MLKKSNVFSISYTIELNIVILEYCINSIWNAV